MTASPAGGNSRGGRSRAGVCGSRGFTARFHCAHPGRRGRKAELRSPRSSSPSPWWSSPIWRQAHLPAADVILLIVALHPRAAALQIIVRELWQPPRRAGRWAAATELPARAPSRRRAQRSCRSTAARRATGWRARASATSRVCPADKDRPRPLSALRAGTLDRVRVQRQLPLAVAFEALPPSCRRTRRASQEHAAVLVAVVRERPEGLGDPGPDEARSSPTSGPAARSSAKRWSRAWPGCPGGQARRPARPAPAGGCGGSLPRRSAGSEGEPDPGSAPAAQVPAA